MELPAPVAPRQGVTRRAIESQPYVTRYAEEQQEREGQNKHTLPARLHWCQAGDNAAPRCPSCCSAARQRTWSSSAAMVDVLSYWLTCWEMPQVLSASSVAPLLYALQRPAKPLWPCIAPRCESIQFAAAAFSK